MLRYEEKEKDCVKEIYFKGTFTFRDHDTFFEVVNMIRWNPGISMVFNLKDLEFLDSAAMGMLVIAHDEATSRNVSLAIKDAQGKTLEYLLAARMDTLYFMIQNKVEEEKVEAEVKKEEVEEEKPVKPVKKVKPLKVIKKKVKKKTSTLDKIISFFTE